MTVEQPASPADGSDPATTSASANDGLRIVGLICDAQSVPIARAQVALINAARAKRGWVPASEVLVRTISDESGRFAMQLQRPVSPDLQLVVRAAEYSKSGTTLATNPTNGIIDVGAIQLARASSIRGTVIANGLPIAGVTVVCGPAPADLSERLDSVYSRPESAIEELPTLGVPVGCVVQSAEDGTFVLSGLHPGKGYTLRAGSVPAVTQLNDVPAPSQGIVMQVDSGVIIRVVVKGQDVPAAWRVVVHYSPPTSGLPVTADPRILDYLVDGAREKSLWFPPGTFKVHVMTGEGGAQVTTPQEELRPGDSRVIDWPYAELRGPEKAALCVTWAETWCPAVAYLISHATGEVRTRDLEGRSATNIVYDDLPEGIYDVVAAGNDGASIRWGTVRVEVLLGTAATATLSPYRDASLRFAPAGKSWVIDLHRDDRAWPFLLERADAPAEYVIGGRVITKSTATIHVLPGEYKVSIRDVESGRKETRAIVATADKITDVEAP